VIRIIFIFFIRRSLNYYCNICGKPAYQFEEGRILCEKHSKELGWLDSTVIDLGDIDK